MFAKVRTEKAPVFVIVRNEKGWTIGQSSTPKGWYCSEKFGAKKGPDKHVHFFLVKSTDSGQNNRFWWAGSAKFGTKKDALSVKVR